MSGVDICPMCPPGTKETKLKNGACNYHFLFPGPILREPEPKKDNVIVRAFKKVFKPKQKPKYDAEKIKKVRELQAMVRKMQKPLKRTPLKRSTNPIRKVSKKRAAQLREYSIKRREYLAANPNCQIKKPGCKGKATQVHHQQGRENELLLDDSKWKSTCDSCHTIITEHSSEAIANGLSISKHKK